MRITFLWLIVLVLALTALPALAEDEAAPAPEPVKLGTPFIDEADVSVHRLEIHCNNYLVTCKETKSFVVVDPSAGIEAAIEEHEKAGHVLKAFWITHEHGDHVTGLGKLAKERKVPIVAHAKAKENIAKFAAAWDEWGFPETVLPPALPDTLVADGEKVTVGKLTFEVRHCPGHSPGSILFLLKGRILLCGDVLFRNSIGRTDLDHSDPEVFAKSLGTKLWDLADGIVVLPGHMETTTIGVEKKENWLFQDFARKGRGEPPLARPWMGIGIDQEFEGPGIRLTQVAEGSPAEGAGLAIGDVILRFDGVEIKTPMDLIGVIRKHAIGDAVSIVYVREGTEITGKLTFGKKPPV